MKNPIEEFQSFKTKESSDKAKEDLRLWNQWHTGGRTAEGLEPLMKRYEGPMANRQRLWKAPSVNPSAFKAELQKHFINAAHSFDPNRGTAFNTHLDNYLKKAIRFNTQHQNIGYIPEEKAKHIGAINRAVDALTEDLGRAPTSSEIGGFIGMPASRVSTIQKSLRKDISESSFETDPIEFTGSREQDVIRLISKAPEQYLSPDEANVFKSIYGVGVAKVTSTGTLAQKLNMSQSRISRLKNSVAAKIKKNIGPT